MKKESEEHKLTTYREINKYLKKIANSNKPRNVMFRGFLNGVFTAVGATIGFAIFIFLASRIYSSIGDIQFVQNFLRETKIDVLIESQINRITEEESAPPEDDNADNNSYISYANEKLGFSFAYPSSLENIKESNNSTTLTGAGQIQYLNVEKLKELPQIKEDRITQITNVPNVGQVRIYIFGNGLNIEDQELEGTVFIAFVNQGESYIQFKAKGSDTTPLIAREIFVKIIESFEALK